jgi:hypothetical protein
MRNLVLAATILGTGLFAWQVGATPVTEAVSPSALSNHSLIEKTGCLLAGRYCGVGFHWVCGLPPNRERRRCHCVPC